MSKRKVESGLRNGEWITDRELVKRRSKTPYIRGDFLDIKKFYKALAKGGDVFIPRDFQSIALILAKQYLRNLSFKDAVIAKTNFILLII